MSGYNAADVPPSRARIARKYLRRRAPISWVGAILGLMLGISGGLFYTWSVNPVVEFDTAPAQLNPADKTHYIVAITLSYANDGDVIRAVDRLVNLQLEGDPIQAVADTACDLATSGYADTERGLNALYSMMRFYGPQGRSGCADELIGVPPAAPTIPALAQNPTPTLTPPASKTPTLTPVLRPTASPVQVIIPTVPPQNTFALIDANTFCDVARSGLIEVYVYELNGSVGVPGQAIRARGGGGESVFFTGLKPERGPAYADFQMTAGQSYIIDMPGQSQPIDQPLQAVPCTTPDGQQTTISYRVRFRASG
ncbi:MAG: hypothetical protein GYB67_12840 [Chloroflexi bacterium]|nr:hypothetical protein [Chloroflexota bacterium]